MRYFLDTEFDGFGGPLLSMALVREDGQSMYGVFSREASDPWVAENVIPILDTCPVPASLTIATPTGFARNLASWLAYDMDPVVVTDWPDDIRYLCEALITGPGQMVNVGSIRFEMHRVDAYPTTLPGAVQHNAWWDAMALREKLTGGSAEGVAARQLREAKYMEIPDNWLPTPTNINALPEPVRHYIHQLQTRTDPAGDVRRIAELKDQNAALEALYAATKRKEEIYRDAIDGIAGQDLIEIALDPDWPRRTAAIAARQVAMLEARKEREG